MAEETEPCWRKETTQSTVQTGGREGTKKRPLRSKRRVEKREQTAKDGKQSQERADKTGTRREQQVHGGCGGNGDCYG